MSRVLVFARPGRSSAEAPTRAATASACRPASRATTSGAIARPASVTRRTEWFVTKSPEVCVDDAQDELHDLVRAAALLAIRRCRDRASGRSTRGHARLGREARYGRARAVSHRSRAGLPAPLRAPGRQRLGRACTAPTFFEDVAEHGAAVSARPIPIRRCSSSSTTTSRGFARATAAWPAPRSAVSRRIRGAIARSADGQPVPAELRAARGGQARSTPVPANACSRRRSADARVHGARRSRRAASASPADRR